ncbi:MAG: class I SAM-dependent methyltransferase [bacterium]
MDPQTFQNMARAESSHWWFKARRAILRATINRFIDTTSSLKILEIGCGTGGNLEFLSQFGSLQAVECDSKALLISQKRSIGQVQQGCLPDQLPETLECADLIAMLDVLEHLEQDSNCLKAIQPLLKSNGSLLLTVPALPLLWSPHDRACHHYRRYTKTNLLKTLDAAGYRVEYCSYFNSFLLPVIAPAKWLHRLFNMNQSDDANVPASWLNTLLYRIFSLEKSVLKHSRLPLGVSLIAIAQKNKP